MDANSQETKLEKSMATVDARLKKVENRTGGNSRSSSNLCSAAGVGGSRTSSSGTSNTVLGICWERPSGWFKKAKH